MIGSFFSNCCASLRFCINEFWTTCVAFVSDDVRKVSCSDDTVLGFLFVIVCGNVLVNSALICFLTLDTLCASEAHCSTSMGESRLWGFPSGFGSDSWFVAFAHGSSLELSSLFREIHSGKTCSFEWLFVECVSKLILPLSLM